VVAGFSGIMLAAVYPLYSIYKGELLEGTGRNSLLGTAKWLLAEREPSGSVLDASSATFHMVGSWPTLDHYLLLGGLAAIPVALLVRRLRPVTLALVIQWLVLVRGGHVPFMHVVNLLPWSALLVVGAVEAIAGTRVAWRRALVGVAAVALGAALLFSWTPQLHQMMTVRGELPLRQATEWLGDNVPRHDVMVVHDSIWTDLVHHDGFDPHPVIVYKLDTDPAVRRKLGHLDYLVVPNWYYDTPAAASKYPDPAGGTQARGRGGELRLRRRRRPDLSGQPLVAAGGPPMTVTMETTPRPGGELMRGTTRAVAALAALALAATGCANKPDTTPHPRPPAIKYAGLQHPFRNARLFLNPDTAAGRWRRDNGAGWLDPITSRPQATWLTSPEDLGKLPDLARRAHDQRTLLVLVAYYVPNRGCTRYRDGARSAADYDGWIRQLIQNLGSERAAIVVEPDAAPADCFNRQRAEVLKRAVRRLADAGQYVYIDAGHPGWKSTGEMAERLPDSGVQYAQGFSINVSNRQTTRQSYRWGRELSDLIGNREFVIDTSRNGLCPPPDVPGQETTSGATRHARRLVRRPRRRPPLLVSERCCGSSRQASRMGSAEASTPTCSHQRRRATSSTTSPRCHPPRTFSREGDAVARRLLRTQRDATRDPRDVGVVARGARRPLRQEPRQPARLVEPDWQRVEAHPTDGRAVEAVRRGPRLARQARHHAEVGASEVAETGGAVVDHQAGTPVDHEALRVRQAGVGAGEHRHLRTAEPVLHPLRRRRLAAPAGQLPHGGIGRLHRLQSEPPSGQRLRIAVDDADPLAADARGQVAGQRAASPDQFDEPRRGLAEPRHDPVGALDHGVADVVGIGAAAPGVHLRCQLGFDVALDGMP
jgi:endoglucanase